MKFFQVIVLLCLASGAVAADSVTSVVTSAEELTAKGVTFRRLQLQTPSASVEIESLVASGRGLGRYDSTECVVLKNELQADRLVEADSAPGENEGVARRSKSAKERSVFLVLGKEIPRAYLAFEFSLPSDSGARDVHRYLLPVSVVKSRKSNQALEPATPTVTIPAAREVAPDGVVAHLQR